MRTLHHEFRAAIRATGNSLFNIAIQSKVSRDQLAALLRGADNCTFRTMTNVADRLGVERSAPGTPAPESGHVPSVIDLIRQRLSEASANQNS